MGRSCRACWMQMGTCPCWKNPLCGRSAWRTSSMSCAQLEKARSAGIRVTHLLQLGDRKSTRLNSSHGYISYAVFCLKKKKKEKETNSTKTNECYSDMM